MDETGRQAITFAGVVLAGGRSSRMGTDKAFLDIGGERLVDRQVRLLREAGANPVFLSGRERVDYPGVEAELIYDTVVGLGPLAGIVAALARTETTHLLVLAVDLPRISPEFLRKLIGSCTRGGGAVPRRDRGWEPLCAVYPVDCYEAARRRLNSGHRSPTALVEDLAGEGTMRSLEIGEEEAGLLANWNEPKEID